MGEKQGWIVQLATMVDGFWRSLASNYTTPGEMAYELLNLPGTILDGVVEGALTLKDTMRVMLAFVAGKTPGGNTTSIHLRSQADDKDRIQMTVTEDGDRTDTTVDPS